VPIVLEINRRQFAAVAAALVVVSAACAPAATPPPTGTLVVYSGRSESLVAPIIEQFAAATGINVQVRYGSTPEMAATLLEEGANSPADVFFAQDPGGLGAVAEAGLLAPLPANVLELVPASVRSPDGEWAGVSGRARVVVYNTQRLTPADLPDDIWDFTDPAWRGRLGWAPTNGSFQAMVTAMRSVWGEERTLAWLRGLQANAPVAYEGNTQIVSAVAAGEVDAGFTNHYYLYRYLAEQGESFPARNYFLPSGGPGSLLMVSGAGRLASGRNEANAVRFIEFLLSPQAQQYFASQTYEYPLVPGVALPDGLTPLEELNSLDISLEALADLRGTSVLLSEAGVLP
jgi:iron(III) transport system substrate-binding protein